MDLIDTIKSTVFFVIAYSEKVKSELAGQPFSENKILIESDIAHLPAPARKFVTCSGAIGKSKPQNVRIAFEAEMWSNPRAKPELSLFSSLQLSHSHFFKVFIDTSLKM